jgi:transcriptional regulator with XRE-family HTH domain
MGDSNANGFAKSDDAFAAALRIARERAGITQAELADTMSKRSFDFHQQTIYKIEAGKRRVTIGEGLALADIVGVPIEDLTEVDVRSLRALKRSASRAASDYFEQLTEVASAVRGARESQQEFLMWVKAYEKAAAFADQSDTSQLAAEQYSALVDFNAMEGFAAQWRSLMNLVGIDELLLALEFDEEMIDEWRRLL